MTRRAIFPRRSCAAQGCKVTSCQFPGPFVCARHYRLAFPPRSPERRVWLRVKRQVRKHDAERDWIRLERLWRLAVRRASARELEGFVDVRQIEEILGTC